MSSISSLQSYSSALLLLQQQKADTSGTSATGSTSNSTASTTDSSTSTATTNKNTLSYGSNMTSQLSSMIELTKMAMSAMGIESGGSVTFGQITAYRDDLEEKYTAALQKKMEAAGLDPDMEFRLQTNSEGAVQVISDDANAEKLQAIFDSDSDLTKQYKQLEALSGLEDARAALQIDPSEMKKRVQIESVASWWCSSGKSSASSWFGNYSSGSLNMLSGIDLNV